MDKREPATELHPQFSSPNASPTPWPQACGLVQDAVLYWLSTVRPDGRPHVTPLVGVWHDGAWYFCTGPGERKAENLARNPECVMTTGSNSLAGGVDVVLEGRAVQVTDRATLESLAEKYAAKYGAPFTFGVGEGVFVHDGGEALVFRLDAATGFGFGKGETFSQTRYRF